MSGAPHHGAVERSSSPLRGAGRTVLWLCWVSFLTSLLVALLSLLSLGALAVFD
jgi:hypothetical protein